MVHSTMRRKQGHLYAIRCHMLHILRVRTFVHNPNRLLRIGYTGAQQPGIACVNPCAQ